MVIPNISFKEQHLHSLKLPTRFKSKLYKHNLCGYKNFTLLKKLGYLESTKCKFCSVDPIDYFHIFHDCAFSQFLLAIFEHQIFKHLHVKLNFNIDLINVFYLPITCKKNIKATIFNIVGSVKVNLHNLYYKTYSICNPLDEFRAVTLYNKIISDCKIINPHMIHFNKLYSRPIKNSLFFYYNKAKVEPYVKHFSKFPNNYADSYCQEIDSELNLILKDCFV